MRTALANLLKLPKRSAVRQAAAWAMVLLQLNLFFILLLHHNEFRESLLELCAPTHSAPQLGSETRHSPRELCPACQIARQGAVFPFAAPAVTAQHATTPHVDPIVARFHSINAFLRLPGRDPPRG
jgi:hypothetical protein